MSRGDFGAPSYGSTYDARKRTGNEKLERLFDTIGADIYRIKKNVKILEQCSQTTSKDQEQDLEEKLHSVSQETNKLANVIKQLLIESSDNIKYASTTSQTSLNLRQSSLCKEYENSLKRYRAIQNVVLVRVKAHIAESSAVSEPVADKPESLLNLDDSDDDKNALLPAHLHASQQLIVKEEEDLVEIREREERLQNIERDILDVNSIFRDLATIVHEQGDTIDSIESHIERTQFNVEEGNKQLQRAQSYQKSTRKRKCCLVLLTLVVVTALILLIYFSVKS